MSASVDCVLVLWDVCVVCVCLCDSASFFYGYGYVCWRVRLYGVVAIALPS
jgi:hypothetical protein